MERRFVKVARIGTKDMLADGFMKALPKDIFKNHMARIEMEKRNLD